MKSNLMAVKLAGISLLAGVSAPALAQVNAAPQAASETVVEDIVVTARRREESIQSVPVAISAFSGAQLDQLGIDRAADLRTITPGLNIQPSAGREDSPIYLIRGQRASGDTLTQDGAVSIYVDEMVIGAGQGSGLGLFDLESVQVLKGPQGTLFGRNTTGGAILYSTAKPKDEFEAGFTGGLGNYEQRLAEGFINIPVNDVLKIRAAAQYNYNHGFSKVVEGPLAGLRLRDRDELSGRLTVALEPAVGVTSLTTIYGSRSDTNGGDFIFVGYNPLTAAAFIPGIDQALARQQARSIRESGIQYPNPGQRTRLWGVYNTTTIELSENMTFKNLASYRNLDYLTVDDFDGTSLSILESITDIRSREVSEEAQLLGTAADDKVNYVFGVYYFNQHGPILGEQYALSAINPANPLLFDADFRNKSFSGYGQISWKTPVEGLSATAGFRYTVDSRMYRLSVITAPTAPMPDACQLQQAGVVFTPANCSRSVKESFTSPTWTLGLEYQTDPDTLVYLAHRRGYRSGGFNQTAATDAQFQPFSPENVYDIELGLKRTWDVGGWRVRTNLAVYHQWYKDIQRNVAVFDGFYQAVIRNAASAKIYGGEAEISIEPTQNLRFDFNYSYTHPRYSKYPTVDASGNPIDLSDRLFAYVPAHQLNAALHYEHPLSDGSALGFTATYFYQSSFKFGEQIQNMGHVRELYSPELAALIPDLPGFGQKGYGLLGLRLDWTNIAGTGITASVIGKNVTNKKYNTGGINIYDSLGTAVTTSGDPRTVMGQLSIKF